MERQEAHRNYYYYFIFFCYYYNAPEKKEKKILHTRAGKNDASGVWNQTGKSKYSQKDCKKFRSRNRNLKEEGQSRRKSELEGKNQQSAGEEEGGASNNSQ
jgi:hypothetical protein